MFDALIKIGGSLYARPDLPAITTVWATTAASHKLILLPGGGPFADQVRAADARFHLSHSTAHWMAILAMDQYAYLLANLIPQAVLVRDIVTAEDVCTTGRLAILAPSTLLLQLDPLPHSWQITSDSIAAWLAYYTRIPLLVLLKSIAGVYSQDSAALLRRVSRQALAQSDVVDAGFVDNLAATTRCWILDGSQPERLPELLQQGDTM
ncbi:MAG: hypothetical protein U0401_21950 [Anaerolineae bacterium]